MYIPKQKVATLVYYEKQIVLLLLPFKSTTKYLAICESSALSMKVPLVWDSSLEKCCHPHIICRETKNILRSPQCLWFTGMSNQLQASVHKSASWPPPCCESVYLGHAHRHHHHHSSIVPCSRSDPEAVLSVRRRRPAMSLPLVSQPCIPARDLPHKAESGPVDWCRSFHLLSPCSETLFSIQMTVRTYLVYTVTPFWKLEASNRDERAEQKGVRVITIEVFFLRANTLPLNVGNECASRTFQRAPFTIRRFPRMFWPAKGQLFIESVLENSTAEWKRQEGWNTSPSP